MISVYKKYHFFLVEFVVCLCVRNLEYFSLSFVCVCICFSNIYKIVDIKIIFNFYKNIIFN